MVGKLIVRGVIVGIIASLLAFGVARTLGEPSVNVAIGVEEKHAEAEHAAMIAKGETPPPEEHDPFSRDVQSGVGLLTGIVGIGVGLGAVFGVLFALGYGRLGNLGAKPTAALIGLMGLVTVYVVPALKYPANPPSVGLEETIKLRTGLYFLMIAISVACTFGALFLRSNLAKRIGGWNASIAAAAAYVVVLGLAYVALPAINEVPADFPASTLWSFRLSSLGIQTVLWLGTGVLFGYFSGMQSAERHAPGGMATAH